jgi:hypothetical protein
MLVVYLHIIWFASWILLGVEHYPYGLLTMIMSLEATFLSTFVMISRYGLRPKEAAMTNRAPDAPSGAMALHPRNDGGRLACSLKSG